MSYRDMDIESKFAKAIHNLRKLRPFYSAVYESMKRVESDRVPTMGVSSNELVYNKEFVQGIEFEDLMFVDLHEIGHVALMHVSRRKNRDRNLWNIAADLYVNKLLSEEFNIKPGDTSVDGLVMFSKNYLFCDSIDLNIDYVEKIYDSLNEQAEHNGYNKDKLTGTDDLNKTYHFEYTGSASPENKYNYGMFSNNTAENENWTFKMDFKPDTYVADVLDSNEDQITQENENKRILSEAKVRFQMSCEPGTSPGLLEFHVNEILKSHLDWKKLLRKYCIKATRSDSSFKNPDKRMYYQSAIYPGQAIDEQYALQGVKICFDSSGSISDRDIAYFYGQVRDILKEFKVQAELIYWDTTVESSGDFMSFKEMQNISAAGRGGTDPSCIFNYFDSKKCKIKPIVTLIFTDGYVGDSFNIPKWKRKYKNTIWVMTKNYYKDFKPGFGQVAVARFSE